MLSEIDKDARAIAALQARLTVLETDQLAEKTKLMIHVSAMEDDVRKLKNEVHLLRDEMAGLCQHVLLTDRSGKPIELERVFEGRNLFRSPQPIKHCIVKKSLRLIIAVPYRVGCVVQDNHELRWDLQHSKYLDGDKTFILDVLECKICLDGQKLYCGSNISPYKCFYFVEPI